MNTTTEKKRFTTRDVMVIAAMMVLTFAVYGSYGGLCCICPSFEKARKDDFDCGASALLSA